MSFDKARLDRMHDVLAGHVDRGWAPGLVSLVSRRGEVHVDVIGAQSVDGPPMRRDSIFRIASLGKPVVAAATMILVEECRLRLDDPIDDLLPELAGREVLVRLDGPLDETVPAARPLTVRDLLTFRLGFGAYFGPDIPIFVAAKEKGVAVGPPAPSPLTPDEWIANLGSLPLMAQPGEKWLYHTGSDVLGVLIARVAGQPLEAFLADRIFAPLGMTDTSFFVPEEKRDRFTTQYAEGEDGGLVATDTVADSGWAEPPSFPSAGGGLVSTADDFFAFGQMMLTGGAGILSRKSIELMTTDQLTPAQKAVSGFMPGYFDSRGWGFGVAIDTHRVDLQSVGRYGWDGGTGTSWWADPAEELTGILLSQRLAFPLVSPLYLDFWTSVYQSIE